jgi:GntR family transcriptional regulator
MQLLSTRPAPVYVRIQDAIRKAIAKGVYRAGDRLPSENELADRYGTTRATVAHALQALAYQGAIERRRGSGTFVAAPPVTTGIDTANLAYFERDVFARGHDVAYRVLQFGACAATPEIRQALGLRTSAPVFRLRRLRVVERKPLAMEERFLSGLVAAQLDAAALQARPIQELFEEIGLPIARIANEVRVAIVPRGFARPLGIAADRPVLVREHTFLDAQGKPLLWGATYYREEYRIQYSLNK